MNTFVCLIREREQGNSDPLKLAVMVLVAHVHSVILVCFLHHYWTNSLQACDVIPLDFSFSQICAWFSSKYLLNWATSSMSIKRHRFTITSWLQATKNNHCSQPQSPVLIRTQPPISGLDSERVFMVLPAFSGCSLIKLDTLLCSVLQEEFFTITKWH